MRAHPSTANIYSCFHAPLGQYHFPKDNTQCTAVRHFRILHVCMRARIIPTKEVTWYSISVLTLSSGACASLTVRRMNLTHSDVCCAFNAPLLDRLLPPILVLEFMFGLMGNVVALWMFIFHMDEWKPNSVYLTHLAVADSIVLFCLPFRADYYRRGKNWLYGDAMCRILLFLLAANRAAGIFFLTAVAVDRYLKIVHPLNRINRMGLGYALVVSLGLWGLIFLATGYLLANEHFFYNANRTQCESFNICMGFSPLSTWHNTFYVVQFFLPTSIVAFCTIRITWQLRSRTLDKTGKIKRAVQFVLAVALIFITCFFPSTISRIAVWILKVWYNECKYFEEANLAFYTSVCFTYFNSVLNPVVYYFSSPAFSGTFKKLLNKLLGRADDKEEPQSSENDISTVDGRRI